MLIYYPNTFLTNYSFRLCLRNKWSGSVVFGDNCRYVTKDPDNQGDYIKLFGIRKSPLPISLKKNGAYLAWSYVPELDKIRCAWYLHDSKGGFHFMPKKEAPLFDIGAQVDLEIENIYDCFCFKLGNIQIDIDKSKYKIDNFKQGWSLQPWGGGSETVGYSRKVKIN